LLNFACSSLYGASLVSVIGMHNLRYDLFIAYHAGEQLGGMLVGFIILDSPTYYCAVKQVHDGIRIFE